MATFRGIELPTLQTRIQTHSWAAAIYERVRKQTEPMIARPPTVFPAENPSGWKHNFTCPTCAELLVFDLDSPESHFCRLCGKAFSDPAMNAAWVYEHNIQAIQAAEIGCLVSAIEGDLTGAEWARELLLKYTAAYASYEPHGDHAGKGKIQAQSLDEAVWMLPAVRVYQSLRALNLLTPPESAKVRDELFAPAIELLRPQTREVHNIHLWHASAIWAMAVELGQEEDRKFAEAHISLCVTDGVLTDGSWYEGSPLYHFYTLDAFASYLIAARIVGREPVMVAQVKKMFTSQILLLRPDWEYPAFNDGWPRHPLANTAPFFELGEYLFGGFQAALHTIYKICGAERSSLEALLHGPDEISEETLEFPALVTVDGVAVMRRGDYTAYVKSTPNGGGHDHNDKPAFYLYSNSGKLNAGDLGNPGYGNPLHRGYFRQTISHNTVVVDDLNQQWSNGRIISAQNCPYYSLISAADDEAYPGVEIRRWTCVGADWAIDRTLVTCQEPRAILWLFHTDGILEFPGTLEWKEAAFTGNKHFSGQRLATMPSNAADAVWRSKSPGELWRMRLQTTTPSEVGQAIAPALPATESVAVLAVRTQGTVLDICNVLRLRDSAPEIKLERNEAKEAIAHVGLGTPVTVKLA